MRAVKFEEVPLNVPFWLTRDASTYYIRLNSRLIERHPENGPVTTRENFDHTMNVYVED